MYKLFYNAIVILKRIEEGGKLQSLHMPESDN